jgi:hypothetical protein
MREEFGDHHNIVSYVLPPTTVEALYSYRAK